MKVTKLVILWLSASECLAQIIKESLKANALRSLGDVAVEILSRCYENQVNTVGLAGISDSFLFETLSARQSLSVTLIGDATHKGPVKRVSRHKLQLFVVTASSAEQLEATLRQIKSSLWWNHMATFLILDGQSAKTEDGCPNASEFLWTAWKMNVLKATYLCVHVTKGRLIYSYNPYTSNGPESFKLDNTYKRQNDQLWTVFLREYDGVDEICENLEFDKTNDLAGYKINATVKEIPRVLLIHPNITGMNSITGSFGNLARAIFHALNATAGLTVHSHMQSPGFLDTKGIDVAMDTVNGISDVLLSPRLHTAVENFTVSYHFVYSGQMIVTQYSGNQSQLEKLLTVLDKSSRIGVCLVALSIVIFFKFLRRESIGTAILNTVRIITNSSLTVVPKNQGARIYLATVFFLVVTIVGIYQGLLASLLTKSKPRPNVNTMQDLRDRGYTIYAHASYSHFFADALFKNAFVPSDDLDCTKAVLLDFSAACVAADPIIFEVATKLKLHISRHQVFKSSVVYVIRKDWPLEEKFNRVLGSLTEAHIPRYILNVERETILRIARFNDAPKKNQERKVMTLRDLMFAFGILGIGLACATVSFIVEVAIAPSRPKIGNVGSRIRNRVRFKETRFR